ncbi:MAG: sigma-54 factor interaction domain-containing protein [Acidobacteria bacterium]|nr:sigma-54 factor interaction domain-containing protein [Acidobacteriota bacterium]
MPAAAMSGRAPWPRPRRHHPHALAGRPEGDSPDPSDLLGSSPAMVELRRAVLQAAAAPFPVLVEGESGTGKELVARSVHACGPRRAQPFAAINCAAFSDELLETELFGHARGAFTGAVSTRRGLFEEASGGTLFLDEVGELSPRAQAKLLRVLQDGEIRKVGESVSRHVDVRIVAATNRRLRDEVHAGRFRSDLLYRLEVGRPAGSAAWTGRGARPTSGRRRRGRSEAAGRSRRARWRH